MSFYMMWVQNTWKRLCGTGFDLKKNVHDGGHDCEVKKFSFANKDNGRKIKLLVMGEGMKYFKYYSIIWCWC